MTCINLLPLNNQIDVSLPFKASSSISKSIRNVLDKSLLVCSSKIQLILVEKFIKKLNSLTSPLDWKNQAQSIIHIYLSQMQNLKTNHREKLETLEEDFKAHSLYEIYTKYSAWLKHFELDAEEDPLFLNLLKLLFSESVENIIQQEMSSVVQQIVDKQFEWIPVQRDEMLRLLVQVIKEKMNTKGLDFDCYVLDYKELPSFLSLVERQINQQKIPEKRLFLLVRNEVHYTALDCQYKQTEKSCIILDASQDPKHEILEKDLRIRGFNVIIAGESEDDKIQLDYRSCSIFSLNQLSQIAKEEHLFQKMKRNPFFNPRTNRLPWIALNPGLIKDSQDLKFLKRYFEVYQQALYKNESFDSYMRKKLNEQRSETEKNTGIERKLEKYVKIVLDRLQSDSVERINQVARIHPFMVISQSLSEEKQLSILGS